MKKNITVKMREIELEMDKMVGETLKEAVEYGMTAEELNHTLMLFNIYRDVKELLVDTCEWMDSVGEQLDRLERNNEEILDLVKRMERMRA